ncbi:MAG: choice-of-anchor G family protein, partial [Specibacter sp.]
MIDEIRNRASGRGARSLRTGSKILAGGVAASMVFMSMGGASAAPEDDSEAMGQVISTDLLTLDLLDVATSTAGNPSNLGPNAEPINLELLGALGLDLGSLTLPLLNDGTNSGLLDLGALGVLNSYASAPTATEAAAAAGAVGEDGAIAVDGNAGGKTGNAKVDLTSLLAQLGLDPATDPIVRELSLEIGALASTATENAGAVSSEYLVADAKVNIESPAVGNLTTAVGEVVDGLGVTLNDVAGTDSPLLGTITGILGSLNLAGIGLSDVVIGLDGVDTALNGVKTNLITKNASDPNGIVNINLGTGVVSLDLAKAFDSVNGLNGQAPNTEVINAATLAAVTTALGLAIDDLTATVTQEIKNAINSIRLVTTATVEAGIVGGTATIDASLGQLLGTDATDPIVDVNLTGLGAGLIETTLTVALNTVALPLIKGAVGTVLNPVLDGVGTLVSGAVAPLVIGLTPVIDGILASLVQITINEQPTPGLLGAESFTVSALTLTLLPSLDAAKVSLATSTVRALDTPVVVEPTIIATPSTVPDGDTTVVTGENFPANTDVTVQIVDGSGNPIGAPVTVLSNAAGEITATLTVPAETAAGTDFQVEATTAGGDEATTPLAVTNDDNTADNTTENTAVNTAENGAENTAVN